MPHKVEISDKTYEKLREYCELNDLKMGSMADKFIYDGLMIEMYGDVPFTDYKERKPKRHEEMVTIQVPTILGPEPTYTEVPTPQSVPGVEEALVNLTEGKNEVVNDEKRDDALKNAGVPDKVVNRITKRRLK